MKHLTTAAALLLLAACAKPAPDNVVTANVADPMVTEVQDDSAPANAVDDSNMVDANGANTADK